MQSAVVIHNLKSTGFPKFPLSFLKLSWIQLKEGLQGYFSILQRSISIQSVNLPRRLKNLLSLRCQDSTHPK